EPKDLPVSRLQAPVRIAVPGDVGFKLACPPLRVRLWSRAMTRATVPEAPVHKDRDAGAREDDVGAAMHARDDRAVDSVPQSQAVKFSTERHLGLGVSLGLPLHPPKSGRRRRTRCGHHTLAKVVSYSFAMRT